jgi:pimeloyl-ACP methyl ester carboxylesterase
MAYATIDGIQTHYEVTGDGPPIMLFAPAGFDASIQRWSLNGVWKEMRPLESLAKEFRLIAYDRREAGLSCGRLEPLHWPLYAKHAIGLLDHLGIDRAFMLGACMGCSVALTIGALFPKRCAGLLLHWPVGGYRWMLKTRSIFDKHIGYVKEQGLQGVAERARKSGVFFYDPECGPWSAAIANDPELAKAFVRQDPAAYVALVEECRDTLFHDTMPSGATGDQLMKMDIPGYIMSGDDAAHSHSAAHALRELMPRAALSPVMPPQQNPASVSEWIRQSVAAVLREGRPVQLAK